MMNNYCKQCMTKKERKTTSFLDPIPVPKAKDDDLMHLKQFCGPEATDYFNHLPH